MIRVYLLVKGTYPYPEIPEEVLDALREELERHAAAYGIKGIRIDAVAMPMPDRSK